MKKAFEILLADPKVKSIFINIFGGTYSSASTIIQSFGLIARRLSGIMRCDYIAEGVIKATKELQLQIPLVVRLKGTKEAEAKEYVHIPPSSAPSDMSRNAYAFLLHCLLPQDDPSIRAEDHPLRQSRRRRRACRSTRCCLNLPQHPF